MPMIHNCISLFLLTTPLSRRGSRTVFLIYPHGWRITTFSWIWLKQNWWSFQPNRSSTTTSSISKLTHHLLFLPKQQEISVIIDDQLTFTAHIASVSQSCRFALYNIRKIRRYLAQYATQLLVQTLVSSRLDYCNALLTGLQACVVKPLKMIQNAAARLVFNQPKRAHVTPLLIELHWLPVDARIKFKSLMLAYRVIAGSAPIYLNALVGANVTPRMLHSSNEHVV